MKKQFATAALFACAITTANAAVILQEDFTSAQAGTLPASLTSSYDPTTDVRVTPLATASPTIGADHSGGDGHVLLVGDLGAGGGSFNWAFQPAGTAQTDVQVSAWVYINFATRDGSPTERDYMLMLRMQNDDPQVTGSAAGTRNGYTFLITADSSWTGISPNPTNFRAFLMKKETATHTLLGSYSGTDIADGWHQLSFKIEGTTLTGSVDGSDVCTATDSTYASGKMAIGYYDDNGSASSFPYAGAFDNLLYETIEPPPSSIATGWEIYQ